MLPDDLHLGRAGVGAIDVQANNLSGKVCTCKHSMLCCRVETLPDDQLLGLFERLLRNTPGAAAALTALPPAPPAAGGKTSPLAAPESVERGTAGPKAKSVVEGEQQRSGAESATTRQRSGGASARSQPPDVADSPLQAASALQQRLFGSLPRPLPEQAEAPAGGAAPADTPQSATEQLASRQPPAPQRQPSQGAQPAEAAAAGSGAVGVQGEQRQTRAAAGSGYSDAAGAPADKASAMATAGRREGEQPADDRTAELLAASGIFMPRPGGNGDAAAAAAAVQEGQPHPRAVLSGALDL